MKIISIILTVVFCTGSLQPLRLRVLDSIGDIVASKKVTVHFEFDKDDSVVYADSIRFSVDSAAVELKSWRSLEDPATEYIPQFRKNKQVYMDSFDIDLTVDFSSVSRAEKSAMLKESNLYLACLTLGKDGRNRSKNMAISLADVLVKKIAPKVEKKLLVKHTQRQQPAADSLGSHYDVWHDDKVFSGVFLYWQKLVDGVTGFFESEAFLLCYLGLLFILLFLLIMRFIPAGYAIFFNTSWKKELSQFICFAWTGFNFYFFKLFFPIYVVFVCVAFYALGVGIYYLREDKEVNSVISRLRLGIGMVLLTMVLPLLIKAYLIKSSLIPGE